MTARRALAIVVTLIAVLVLGATSAAEGGTGSGPTTTLKNDVVRNLNLATLHGAVPSSRTVTVGIFLSNPHQARGHTSTSPHLERYFFNRPGGEDAYVSSSTPSSPNYRSSSARQFTRGSACRPRTSRRPSRGPEQGSDRHPIESATNYFLASGTAAQVAAAFHTPLNIYTAAARDFYANTHRAGGARRRSGISDVLGLNDFNRCRPRTRRSRRRRRTRPAADADERQHAAHRAPEHQGSLVDLRRADHEPRQRPDDGDHRLGRHRPGHPRPPLVRGRVGPSRRAGHGQALRRHVDARHERTARRSSGSSTRRRRPGMAPERQRPRRSTSRTTTATPTPRRVHRLGERQARRRCRRAPRSASARTSATPTRSSPTAWRCRATRSSSRPSPRGARSSPRPATPAPRARSSACRCSARRTASRRSSTPASMAVGQPVGSRRRRHRPARGRQHARERFDETRVGRTPAAATRRASRPAATRPASPRRTASFDPNGNPYVPVAGAAGPLCRSTPDVAAISGDVATGNGMLDQRRQRRRLAGRGHEPLVAALARRLDAHPGRAPTRKGLGFANYAIYKLAKAAPGRDFYDVTVGDNQPYPAKPGYDNTTGWGTPEISQIMLDLTGQLTPTLKVKPAAGRDDASRRRAAISSPTPPATTPTPSRARRSTAPGHVPAARHPQRPRVPLAPTARR